MKNLSQKEILRRLPEALIQRLQRQFSSPEFSGILRGFLAERLPAIRLNSLVQDPTETLSKLRAQNILLQNFSGIPLAYQVRNASEKNLIETTEAKRGAFLLQGFSSQLPVFFLKPQPGERIWDMCAAPGSKTSQIAAETRGEATILASELDKIRYEKLLNTLQVQQCTAFVEAKCANALSLVKEYPEYFDAILLDAPCSAEGRIALFHPETSRFWSEKNIVAHAKVQRQLFRAAMKALRPGGRLLYSTCTLAPEENEQMVSWALTEFSGTLEQLPLKPSEGLTSGKFQGKSFILLPNEHVEGFFVALFRKK